LDSDFSYKAPNEKLGLVERKTIVNSYPISIDFDIENVNDNVFHIGMYIDVNFGTPEDVMVGYSMCFEAVGHFSIDPTITLKEPEKNNLKFFSATNYMINRFRSHILSVTSISAWGPYTLSH
jgi:hypothetical protein